MCAVRQANVMPLSGSGRRPLRESLAVARALGLEGRFGAWRGLSGRRYLVSTVPPERLGEFGAAAFVAVRRLPDGSCRIVATSAGEAAAVLRDARFATADAIDVHLLADDAAARARVVDDLPVSGP